MFIAAEVNEGEEEILETVLIGLGITALVCVFLWFVLDRTRPDWRNTAVAATAIIGALLTLLIAL
jgi:hypothetical protein